MKTFGIITSYDTSLIKHISSLIELAVGSVFQVVSSFILSITILLSPVSF